MVSAHSVATPGPAHVFQNGRHGDKDASLDDFCDAAQAYLSINSPGCAIDWALKSSQAGPVFASLPAEAATNFAYQPAGYRERTPEPVVSIQLADDDADDKSSIQSGSTKGKGSSYQRVWGTGPSPILRRQFQRYSLRGKANKSIGDLTSVANSSGDGEPSFADLCIHSARTTDQASCRPAPPVGPLCSARPVLQRTYNVSSNSMCGSQSCKPSRLDNGSRCSTAMALVHQPPDIRTRTASAPAVHSRTMQALANTSPAPAASSRTPEVRANASPTPEVRPCASPVLPAATRTPGPGIHFGKVPAATFRTPEPRLPRVAYLTPANKGSAPNSALAYRTTASSPGPYPLTPPSALRPSPALGSGPKPIQYQPRGLEVLRHTVAASASGSGVWPRSSPSRSDIIATPNPGMAKTLDGLLLVEDIVAALVARAVELAEERAGSTGRPLREKLAVVSEGDRADTGSEQDDDAGRNCRCNIM